VGWNVGPSGDHINSGVRLSNFSWRYTITTGKQTHPAPSPHLDAHRQQRDEQVQDGGDGGAPRVTPAHRVHHCGVALATGDHSASHGNHKVLICARYHGVHAPAPPRLRYCPTQWRGLHPVRVIDDVPHTQPLAQLGDVNRGGGCGAAAPLGDQGFGVWGGQGSGSRVLGFGEVRVQDPGSRMQQEAGGSQELVVRVLSLDV